MYNVCVLLLPKKIHEDTVLREKEDEEVRIFFRHLRFRRIRIRDDCNCWIGSEYARPCVVRLEGLSESVSRSMLDPAREILNLHV